MKVAVLNQKGEKVKDMELNNVFDKTISKEMLALYINYLRNALRAPIANTKDRGEVSGGGKKPFKQKGTGRARQGSTRSPLWVGGGVTFGPTNERNFRTKINKTQKRNIILGIFGEAFKQNKAVVLESLALESQKTKDAASILSTIKAEGKISVIANNTDKGADLAFRNLAGISLMTPNRLNIIDIVSSDKVVLSVEAVKGIEEQFSKKEAK